MSNIINIANNGGQLVVTSREVAENFERDHSKVLRSIETTMLNQPSQNWIGYFISSEYTDAKGETRKEYLLTRDGFSLLVMGFTGVKAIQWKMKYIEAFNYMERTIGNSKDSNMTAISLLHGEVGQLIAATSQIGGRVENLEKSMTVDYCQQLILQDAAKAAAINAMGGKDKPSYRNSSIRGRVFTQMWKDYKEYFEVNSYKNTARVEMDRAKDYLKNWRVQGKTLREIERINEKLNKSGGKI